MFNVGDEVEVISDVNNNYDFTRVGSLGRVIWVESNHLEVEFTFINNPSWSGDTTLTFSIKIADLALVAAVGRIDLVTRKIRSIYARQYRKTKLPCFL